MKKFSKTYIKRTEVITILENGHATQEFYDNATGIKFKTWHDNIYAGYGWETETDYIERLKELNFKQIA